MNSPCPSCSARLEPSWRFCPSCGAAHPAEHPLPHETEKMPVRKAFGGLLWGFIVAPIMIIVGALLCLTGLGAFLGIPLIAGGLLAPLAGPMIGLGELKGDCPWCGAAVTSILNKPGFACHACGRRIEIHDHKFVRGEAAEQPAAKPAPSA